MISFFEQNTFWMKNLENRKRSFPSGLPLTNVGYCPQKTGRLVASFLTCNFSFILSGGGSYRNRSGEWTVKAPCVLMQWPGEEFSYGPGSSATDQPAANWEEFYLMYDATCIPRLKALGFYRTDNPVWRMNHASTVRHGIGELYTLCEKDSGYGLADRADRIGESLILESLLNEPVRERNNSEKAFLALLNELESRLPEPVDFMQLARRHGFSQSTFRRQWKKQIAVSPARYVMEHRLQHAGRLLTDTALSISEIAGRIHFEDPLYFSRRFRAFSGLSPTEFRRRYRNPA
ncbi:helix-turn-helix domain-containing protein [Verrucomicrobia bacterium S94]|nr:helix-turn-helix domain-containing protein [Verrucomicrobia bacterium S94]